ncbi:alpha/beta hydrolase [Streptomyces wuyuanensis]|uniref:alpha/beta hydrolase n=1 Tax=Streptomyces wuyuanensis TaxID=1196353 RepID=UPI003717A18D
MSQTIHFDSDGRTLVGTLFLPEDHQDGRRHPALVMLAPMGGYKEHAPYHYAPKFAQHGYAVLAFDYSFYGESQGEPRTLEDPFAKLEDIRNAVTFLTLRQEVDAERIGLWGVCAGGGYAFHAAIGDRRVKAVGTASAMIDLAGMVTGGHGGDWRALMAAAGAARTAYARGEKAQVVPFLPPIGDDGPWRNARSFYTDPERNRVQGWKDQNVIWSYDKLVHWNPNEYVHMVAPTPILLCAGRDAETVQQSLTAHERGGDNTELFLLDGALHFDLYDQDRYTDPVVTRAAEFFARNL